MARNKIYKRKAKRLIGHCMHTKCCDCKHLLHIPQFDYFYGEIEYYPACEFGYEGEGIRWLEREFKGKKVKFRRNKL